MIKLEPEQMYFFYWSKSRIFPNNTKIKANESFNGT